MILYLCLNLFEKMSGKMFYKEGQTIQFKIKKHVELSENEHFYVLEDQFGRKQLLNSEFYEKYNFRIEQFINCRVDHINCSGKIFLEPEHPYYIEGEFYDFIINEIDLKKNNLDDYIIEIKLTDEIGNEAICKIDDDSYENYSGGQIIRCKVERIKKGKLHLSYVNNTSSVDFKRGEYYKFLLEDIRILSDNIKYYILSDDKGKKYFLKYEYYENHNLKIGQFIECTILKYSSKGFYILEPKHPYYEIDKEYNFEFLKQEKDIKGSYTGNYDISVKDTFGNEVKFVSNKSFLIDGDKPEIIKCKVTGIKKGKPLLSV